LNIIVIVADSLRAGHPEAADALELTLRRFADGVSRV